jgi:hypothetical protein
LKKTLHSASNICGLTIPLLNAYHHRNGKSHEHPLLAGKVKYPKMRRVRMELSG